MLTDDLIKEELSICYMHAITAICGYEFNLRRVDVDSSDATIIAKIDDPNASVTRPRLEVQLKATNQERVHRSFARNQPHFSYELKKKNYNDLCVQSPGEARLLVVLLLPEEKEDWLLHSHAALSLRYCAYWHCLGGNDPIVGRSKSIRIDKDHECSPEQLQALMHKVANEEDIIP